MQGLDRTPSGSAGPVLREIVARSVTGRWRGTVLLVVTLALVAGGIACDGRSAPRAIVLVVVDTLRPDHMSLYGYERPTTPELEDWAEEGVVYERAFTTAPWTLPGIGSIFTGLLPSGHGGGRVRFDAGEHRVSGMREGIPTLMNYLQEAGWSTGGLANAPYINDGFGFDRGFDRYDWQGASDSDVRTADVTVDRALDWVDERGDEPFFLFVHLFDPHRHYDAPEPFRGVYTDRFADRYGDTLATLESRERAESELHWEFIEAAYDEEVAFVDHEVARLLEGLRDRGLWRESLVVLTADHGEAMDEHDTPGHGRTLYDEVLRVPFVVWGPGVSPGRRDDPVSTVDIAPTLLAAAGVDPDRTEPRMAGVSLLDNLTAGEPLPERMLFAERIFNATRELKAVIRWPYKAIIDPDSEERELYDLSRDPDERRDLWGQRSDEFYDFLSAMQRLRQAEREAQAELQDLDPEIAKSLRALGYVR